jgi:hypothetical protein
MRKASILCAAVVFVAAAAAGRAALARSTYTVVVSARDTGYEQTPVSITIAAPRCARSVALRDAGGEPVSCDADFQGGAVQVTWMLHDLPKGASRRYALEFSSRPRRQKALAVRVYRWQGAMEVGINGAVFTRYNFAGAPKPFCYPVIGPTGEPVTRSYPMDKAAGESTDHPHHRSFWFAHGNVNGHDFWGEGDEAGKIVHRAFEALRSGSVMGRIGARNDWVTGDGKKVCEEVRELRVYNISRGRLVDFEVTVIATEGPIEFGDTKEGMMAFRVASSMEVTRKNGHILNSEGQRDVPAWGKRANWCDYWGPVGTKTVGIAILDNPANFRHPTYWHVRDYGLFAANPFGVRDFVGKEAPSGAHSIPKGGSITFRYRIFIHEGDAQQADIAGLWNQYAHPPVVRVY